MKISHLAEPPECKSSLPLCQFEPGRVLCFKFNIGSGGFYARCVGKFIRIDRGIVEIKITDILTPEWFDERALLHYYPDKIARVRPTSCYLWGKIEPGTGLV